MSRPANTTINAWRGIFAVCIVLFHYYPDGRFDQLAWSGVNFFLVAAGYLNAMHHGDTMWTAPAWGRFVGKRARRLYPLHWLALAAVLLFNWRYLGKLPTGGTLALNAGLLHAWVPRHEVYLSLNVPAWFLSTILFCYAATPPLLVVLRRLSTRRCLALAATLCVGFAVACPWLPQSWRDFFFFFPPTRLIDYFLGMVLYRLVRDARQAVPHGKRPLALEVGALVLFAAAIALNRLCREATAPWENTPLWWLPIGTIIFVAGYNEGREGLIGKFLALRPFKWLGRISFETYLFQVVAAMAVSHLVCPLGSHCGVDLYPVAHLMSLALLLFGATLLHRATRRKR